MISGRWQGGSQNRDSHCKDLAFTLGEEPLGNSGHRSDCFLFLFLFLS